MEQEIDQDQWMNEFRKTIMRMRDKYANKSEETIVVEEESESDLCDSTHLLQRNTKSFLCLTQLLMSRSSFTESISTISPPIEDSEIKLESELEIDDVGADIYKKLCEEMHIVPITRILTSLETDTLNMRYYSLSENQIKALTEALKVNSHVQTLILEENVLNTEMCRMLSDMLSENICLQALSLHECRIGETGAEELGKVLSGLENLYILDLSFNDLDDKGLAFLEYGLTNSISIKALNLSHNNLTEVSGEILGSIFRTNNTIEDLNLSWNGFFTAEGNAKLFSGLSQTDNLRVLNISWNGLGVPPTIQPLVTYLKKSKFLQELDLSNNRLDSDSIVLIREAIRRNQSLQHLKIGNNIYSPADAHSLLTVLTMKEYLSYMDMENVFINKGTKTILKKIRELGKEVKIGGILSDFEIKGPNPRKLIYERCKYLLNKPKKIKARKDFGHFILLLPPNPINQEDFQNQLKKLKMKKLDKVLVQGLMDLFLTQEKEVNCPELVTDYMSFYPDTKLPPPKPIKRKKGKKKKKKKV